MRENMRYAQFLQNMRNMLRSHDRYKPVSLVKELLIARVENVQVLISHRFLERIMIKL